MTQPLLDTRVGAATIEPCVVYRCNGFVFATPLPWVERLALPEEATVEPGRSDVLSVGERDYAIHNLGTLLGLDPAFGAWILLKLPSAHREIRIALAVSSCAMIAPVVDAHSVPTDVFRARVYAIRGVFSVDAVLPKGGGGVGFVLDVGALWTEEELASAHHTVGVGARSPP